MSVLDNTAVLSKRAYAHKRSHDAGTTRKVTMTLSPYALSLFVHCPVPWFPIAQVIVDRDSHSPTLTCTDAESGHVWRVTPCRILESYGIRVLRGDEPFLPGDMDVHYSVLTYLWALEVYGWGPVVRRWPAQNIPRSAYCMEPRVPSVFRLEYAFVFLLSFVGDCDPCVAAIRRHVRGIWSTEERLCELQRLARHYVRQQVKPVPGEYGDSMYCPDGFLTLLRAGIPLRHGMIAA